MADAPGEQLVQIDLMDWKGGVKNKRANPLVTPMDSFVDGENLDMSDGYLRTMRSPESVAGFQSGIEVTRIFQIRFPTQNVHYTVIQVKYEEGGGPA